MISLVEFKSLSRSGRQSYLQENHKANGIGGPRKMIEGFGVNDSEYYCQPSIDGVVVMCPAYKDWHNMIKRCYSSSHHAKRPSYIGTSVCNDWSSFVKFLEWWKLNQVDGFVIDKDILSDSGVYSPETCLFVPVWLNSFILDSAATRGPYPIGASFHKQSGRFKAQCRNPHTLVNEYIGLFKTPSEAHEAWKSRKISYAEERKNEMDLLDSRVFDRVVEIIKNLK